MPSRDKRIKPLNHFSGARGAIALITVGFINRVASILNAIIGVRGTGGIRVIWSDGGLVIDGSQISGIPSDATGREWLIVCRLDNDGQMRRYATAVSCSKLYPVSAIEGGRYEVTTSGGPETITPFSDTPLPS